MVTEQRFDQFQRALGLIIHLREQGSMHIKDLQETLGRRGLDCHQRTIYGDMEFLAQTGLVEMDRVWGGGTRWSINEDHPLLTPQTDQSAGDSQSVEIAI